MYTRVTASKSKGTTTHVRRKSEGRKAVFNSNKNEKITDDRLSVCNKCNRGIFKARHTWEWTKRGFLHTECVTDEDKIAA